MPADLAPMDLKHLEALVAVDRSYWWHVGKRELVVDLLRRRCPPPARVVEGGVGGGATLLALRDVGYDVSGFDVMPESVAHCRSLGLADVRQHDLERPWPVERGPARAVVLLDVIEHVPNPVQVLKHAAEVLAPDGEIIVTVPAIAALYGPWDRMLGHYRRYSARLLRSQAREAGLRVDWLSHWNSFTLPAAVVVRTLERLRLKRRAGTEFPAVSPRVNALLTALARLERRGMGTVRIPLGLSLVGVLKR